MLVHHRTPSMKWLGVLLLPLDGMLVHHRVPSMKRLGVLLLPLDGMLVHHRVPNMKQLGALLLPPGWDASSSQATQHEATRSITTPPWIRCSWSITGLLYTWQTNWSKLSCPRKQHNAFRPMQRPCQDSNQWPYFDILIGSPFQSPTL